MTARTLLIVDPTEEADRLVGYCSDHGLTVLRACRAESGLELLLSGAPEAAIIEVDLPDASGLDFAEVLRGEEVPLFFTSADRLPALDPELSAAMRHAVGFLMKPYAADTIVEEIARALAIGREELELEAAAKVDQAGERWGQDDVADEAPVPGIERTVSEESAAPGSIEPARGDTPEDDAPEEEPAIDAEGEEPAAPALDQAAHDVREADRRTRGIIESWERKIESYRQRQPGARDEIPRSGSLAQTSVVQLYTYFHQNRLSGELALVRQRAKRLVLFSHGYPVFARSNLARERFGPQLVALGALSEEQLKTALEGLEGKERRLGEALVKRGLIDDATRRRVLVRVVRHVVLASFGWSDGEYRVGLVERARNEPFTVPMFTGNVILRGLALTTPLDTLRWAVPQDARFAPVPDPIYPLELVKLNDREARILVAVDGTKTVADLASLFGADERTLLGLLYGLTKLNLLELVGHGPARPRAIEFF